MALLCISFSLSPFNPLLCLSSFSLLVSFFHSCNLHFNIFIIILIFISISNFDNQIHTTKTGIDLFVAAMPNYEQVALFVDCPPGMRPNDDHFCGVCPNGTAGVSCAVCFNNQYCFIISLFIFLLFILLFVGFNHNVCSYVRQGISVMDKG